MPETTYLKRRVAYLIEGLGVPLVLLHAGGASGRQWKRTIEALGADFRVVAPDLWGFGNTEEWPGSEELSHDHQASLVANLIDELGLGPVHVVGHSYGGASAVRLVLREPERVLSLLLIEPILTPLLKLAGEEPMFDEYLSMAQAFLRNVAQSDPEKAWQGFIDYRNGAGTWDSLPPPTKERFLRGTRGAVAGFHSNLNNPTTLDDLATISVPSLVLCGELTTAPDRRVTEIVRDSIQESRYEVIPGAEHMSPLSHPESIASAIRKHIASLA